MEINKCFLVLGLDSTASFEQVKEARGWYSKAFHPDRFPQGSQDAVKALEKQKQINLAFEELQKWFHSRAVHPTKPASHTSQRRTQKSRGWNFELDSYAQILQQSPKSPSTIKNTFSDLRTFATYISATRAQTFDFHGEDLEDIVSSYATALDGYKPSTVARHLYSIRGLLDYVGVDTGFVTSLAYEYKSEVKPRLRILTPKQVLNFFQVVEADATDEDTALIRFIFHTGVTASELCALEWNDLSAAHVPKLRGRSIMINVTGRSANRYVPLDDAAVGALTLLGFKGILPIKGKLSATTIFSRGGFEMSPKMVHYVVDRYAKLARLSVTPSILRATFCHRLAKGGMPLQHLAALVGITEQSAKVYYGSAEPNVIDLFAYVKD
jgi:site-specific recombinase XerD